MSENGYSIVCIADISPPVSIESYKDFAVYPEQLRVIRDFAVTCLICCDVGELTVPWTIAVPSLQQTHVVSVRAGELPVLKRGPPRCSSQRQEDFTHLLNPGVLHVTCECFR